MSHNLDRPEGHRLNRLSPRMTLARLLPERTVDSAIAIELVRFDPHALIWSPSQRAPVPFDHELLSARLASAFFEAKAVERGNPPTVPIDITQLRTYLQIGLDPLFYLLPVAPTRVSTPHSTICKIDGCCSSPGSGPRPNTQCVCCPRDARTWTWLEAHYQSCPTPIRTQPWFSHWCWAVSARDLSSHPSVAAALRANTASVVLDATDRRLGGIPGAMRLCHLLGVNWRQYFSVERLSADVQAQLSNHRVDHLHLALRPDET